MNTVEDRMRAAARAVADTVPEGSAPPLYLPERRPRAAAGPRLRRQWRAWRTPAGAAAAVTAVIALSVAIVPRPAGTPGAAAVPKEIPPYYVAEAPAGHQIVAVIRSTATGRAVARIPPPRPYVRFNLVTASDDDRTFVLGAQRRAGAVILTRFYLLSIGPAGQPVALSPLSLPQESSTVSGLALSPDGRRLALALTPPGLLKITIVTLATGASRTWTGRPWPFYGVGVNSGRPAPHDFLSWTANGRILAYDWLGADGHRPDPALTAGGYGTVGLLDTAASGTSLAAASTAVPHVSLYRSNAIISPDGARIIHPTLRITPSWGIVEISTRTHRNANVLGAIPLRSTRGIPGVYYERIPDIAGQILWSNASGSVLVVHTRAGDLGVLGHGLFVKLPGTMPVNPLGIAW